MFFPSQTSFIPVTVALVKYIEAHGFSGLYPYWYLGTTPTKYLIGPVVPVILIGLHKVLPLFSFFELSFLSLITFHFVLSIGWGILAWRLSGKRMVGWWVGILVLFIPWHWVSALGLSEVSAVFAQTLTPWVLLVFARGPVSRFIPVSAQSRVKSYVDDNSNGSLRADGSPFTTATPREVYPESNRRVMFLKCLPSFVFALLLLTNSTASLSAIIGMIVISISNFKFQITNLKKAATVVLFGWLLSSLWYGFGYWLTILGAPSVGGQSLVGALFNFIGGLRNLIPAGLAIAVVSWGIKPKNLFEKFAYSWLLVFLSMTLIRFMAAPGFWIDWTSWGGEVEIGLALIFSARISNFKFQISNWFTALLIIYLIVGWFFAWQNRDFWLPRVDITNTSEYKIASWLESHSVNCEPTTLNCSTVFLSGSTAFWLNSLVDVKQVRGGRDEVSVNDDWRKEAFVVREGTSSLSAVEALRRLDASYVVVHGDESAEYYHDFKHPGMFTNSELFEKVWDGDGERIYKINF